MHPNCRSTTQLVLDSDSKKEKRSNNPEKPKSSSKKDTSENEKPVLVETGKQKKVVKYLRNTKPLKRVKMLTLHFIMTMKKWVYLLKRIVRMDNGKNR